MLVEFIHEQNCKQAQLKKERAKKQSIDTKDASIQCSSAVASKLTADASVQTDHYDIAAELRQQIQGLQEVVRELTSLKCLHQRSSEMTPASQPMFGAEELSDVQLDPTFTAAITNFCNGPPDYSSQEVVSADPSESLPVQNHGTMSHFLFSSPMASSRQALMPIEKVATRSSISHGPTDEQRNKVAAIVDLSPNMSNVVLACVDVLFTSDEMARGNRSGRKGYQQLDTHKLGYLISALKRKFDSPIFTDQWNQIVSRINSKCRGKRRTLINNLKKNSLL